MASPLPEGGASSLDAKPVDVVAPEKEKESSKPEING